MTSHRRRVCLVSRVPRVSPALVVALALAAPLALPTTALAQARHPPARTDPVNSEAKRLFDEGANAYGTGAYEDAIKLWEQAYQISQKPLILDNIANAWEKLGNLRKTREYLARWREAAPPEEQSMLELRLRTLDARIGREDEAARKAADEKAARDAAARAAAMPRPEERPWLPGVIVASAGGAALIAGIVVDVIAKSKRPPSSACEKSATGLTLCQSSAESAITTSNRLAVAGDVTWIAGAVLVAGGVTWALLPTITGGRTLGLTVKPGGMELSGSF